jgi:uncharacterized protein
MIVIGALLALGIGISLGLLGGGGSILTLPLLVSLLRVEPRAAIATSLLVVAVTSTASLVTHARGGHVQWSTGVLLGLSGMLGAAFGARLAHHISPTLLLIGFSMLMVVTAIRMLGGRGASSNRHQTRWPTRALIGTFVGVLSGLFGAGGGFLIVPALVTFAGLGMREAIATSLLVISMQAFAGFATHAGQVALNMPLVMTITVATAIGGLLGSRWSKRVDANALRKGFGVLVLVTGSGMLIHHLPTSVMARPEVPLVAIATAAVLIAIGIARGRQRAGQ